jgi:hypothetical protein
MGDTLRWWLIGQAIRMLYIGVLVVVGLKALVRRGRETEVLHTRLMAAVTVLGRRAAAKFHQEHGGVPVEAAR